MLVSEVSVAEVFSGSMAYNSIKTHFAILEPLPVIVYRAVFKAKYRNHLS